MDSCDTHGVWALSEAGIPNSDMSQCFIFSLTFLLPEEKENVVGVLENTKGSFKNNCNIFTLMWGMFTQDRNADFPQVNPQQKIQTKLCGIFLQICC